MTVSSVCLHGAGAGGIGYFVVGFEHLHLCLYHACAGLRCRAERLGRAEKRRRAVLF